ncbi:MAG TPA: amidohydrolase [Thermoanaerobaculia bacterium]|nr:amidohydrolase [Thermoanaerobaculia bacterium]
MRPTSCRRHAAALVAGCLLGLGGVGLGASACATGGTLSGEEPGTPPTPPAKSGTPNAPPASSPAGASAKSPAAAPAGSSAGRPAPAATAPATSAGAAGEAAGPFPSTYIPLPAKPLLIANATVLTATGERIERGSVLLRDGKIAAVGREIKGNDGVRTLDGTGKWVTPGLVDPHSHLGVYPSPSVSGTFDGNEATDPNTAQVWAEHSVWPQDPQFPLALAGGVTTMQILPGSANLFGGRSVTVKNVPALGVDGMKFPGAPYGLKMACGENPKRVYGERNRFPSTRMGNVAGYREAWIKAAKYRLDWQEYRDKKAAGKEASSPQRDLALETLAGVLDGKILVQNHCYRADEMLVMIDIAREFGFKIAAFHHAVEAYKIAGALAKNGICADMWADWWGFKMEALDGIRENIAMVEHAGACAVVHSDSAEGIQRLNQEAAKAMAAGNRAGISITPEDAIRWITLNPARSLGIDRQTGSLEVGKMADVVVWTGNPFSVYSRAEKVYIDGALMFDLDDPAHRPKTDFELGLRDAPAAIGASGGSPASATRPASAPVTGGQP